jgi:hypothetical protein
LGSTKEDRNNDKDFLKPAPQSKETQTGIRPFGRITKNSVAKSMPKKGQ